MDNTTDMSTTPEICTVGCIYGQYSSLDDFSYDVIHYVGMTATGKENVTAEHIVNKRLSNHLQEKIETTHNPYKVEWYQSVKDAGISNHQRTSGHEGRRAITE